MPPDGGELGRLLAPVTPREFLSRYWGRRPLYIPGGVDKFAELAFDLSILTKAVEPRVPPGYLEVRFVDRQGRLVAGPSNPGDYRPADGVTLQAFRICDRLERLASFCAGIKIGMSLPGIVTMTGYAVPAGLGFGTHFDCQPNFILQVEGSKRWRFSPRPAVAWPPLNVAHAVRAAELKDRYPSLEVAYPPDERDFIEQTLSPGDVLFLPAGTWHQTRSSDLCLSLTMTCIPTTTADVVEDTLRASLSRSEAWRSNVPPVLARDLRPGRLPRSVKRVFEARLAELRRQVRALRAEDLYASWLRGTATFESPLGQSVEGSPPSLGPRDVLTVTRGVPLRIVTDRDRRTISLYHLGHRVDVAESARPLVEALARATRFPAARACAWLGKGTAWEDVAPLLQELVRVGILRIVR
jgi:ribosomal protein L16 Arg81 hydroxylase